MAHVSENSRRLHVEAIDARDFRLRALPTTGDACVWLLVLPFARRVADATKNQRWQQQIREFAGQLPRDSILAIITSAEDAAATLPLLDGLLKFQLWVAVKLGQPRPAGLGSLPNNHAALLVLSKYQICLRHTKTRIAYSYCPVCEKTTKDYGGKKHTYDSYGTLVSDIWRDISWDTSGPPTRIVERLADLFGLDPYHRLRVVDLTNEPDLRPASTELRNEMATDDPAPLAGAGARSRLIHGDCLDVLRSLPAESADFCFADPPYNLSKRYDNCNDSLDIVEYFDWCDRWIDELARVLKPGRTCAVLNIPQWAVRHFSHLVTRLRFQNWIAWEGLSLPVRMIMPAHYSILCFSKGPPRTLPATGRDTRGLDKVLSSLKESYCLRQACVEYRRRAGLSDHEALTDLWWDIHRLKHNSRRVDHPCQLPPALMLRLIGIFTRPGELVLDPFNGAGTTTLCAQMAQRKYIGIELSAHYHALALSRHRLLDSGNDPFGKCADVPKAKNSRVERIGGIQYKIPKKALQLEVREIARGLGHLPTREEVQKLSRYPIRYFDEYFISWGEVCAAARTTGMSETRITRLRGGKADPTLFSAMLEDREAFSRTG